MEIAMELRTSAATIALRTAVRLAWGIARAAKPLEASGERIENAADRQAAGWQVDTADALEPLINERYSA
jgi:hypothetical protein